MHRKVQQFATATLKLCERSGGTIPQDSMLRKLAGLGAHGKHTNNCERDLQRLILNRGGKALDVEIEHVRVHLYNPKTEEESEQDLAMIFPDKMADALYRHDVRVFNQVFFGERVNARDYWEHTRKFTPWINNHPSARCKDVDKLIPISLYGDEVQSFRNTEGGVVSVVAWCSDFSAGLPALSRYLAICVVPDHYTTSQTYLDIWKLLAPRIAHMCSDQVRHVWTTGGYQFTYSSTQGDLKWILEKFGFHDFRANNFCSWCNCRKQHPDPGMTLGNFREDALHRQTRVSHEDFFAELGVAPADFHPLFGIPGCRLERFLHDVCHSRKGLQWQCFVIPC